MLKSFALFLTASFILSGCSSLQPQTAEEQCPRLELYWEICDLAGEPMACLNLQDTQKLKTFMIRCGER